MTSQFTGRITVEDVIYENVEEHLASVSPSKEPVFRRLTFQRTEGLVQSEALLTNKRSEILADEGGENKVVVPVKSKEKVKPKSDQSQQSLTSGNV